MKNTKPNSVSLEAVHTHTHTHGGVSGYLEYNKKYKTQVFCVCFVIDFAKQI